MRATSRSAAGGIGTVKIGLEFVEIGEKGGAFCGERVDQCIEAGVGGKDDCVSDSAEDFVPIVGDACFAEAEQKRKGNGGRHTERQEEVWNS